MSLPDRWASRVLISARSRSSDVVDSLFSRPSAFLRKSQTLAVQLESACIGFLLPPALQVLGVILYTGLLPDGTGAGLGLGLGWGWGWGSGLWGSGLGWAGTGAGVGLNLPLKPRLGLSLKLGFASQFRLGPASHFGLIYLISVCQLFRQISWKIQIDTTYNFYLFCLEGLGLGFRV